ncbi:cold-regulated 413 inner membrane protein 2, chloroplastic-like [Ananas comosus]|uniref:Cold-regulated 413 inner membrane protein 2, chloroplastic n=1 Tax=Ananas comosus TaxID=4615 RepID=A0A199VTL0_ANACO|nr:cold-regulated 413 inner membrane protein 2, chloroplastic-like [Ananas comosus]OAY80030.1 Cold-regulated 413 inner membrane protein 2, chloroplastic [Ananas comosus]
MATLRLFPLRPHSLPQPNKLQSATTINAAAANPLRVGLVEGSPRMPRRGRRSSRGMVVCYAAAPVAAATLQWASTVSAAVLMVAKGTPIQKSFLVPFVALQAPASVVSWIKGEYGMWTAFLALLVRLFYFIPGELELPLIAMLLVITAPYQAMSLRGTQGGAIISLAIAAFLAFQHFSRIGDLRRAFDQGSFIATLAIVCIAVVPCLFLF